MKTKLVLWATKTANAAAETPESQKVLVALELLPQENKVKSWTIDGEQANVDFYKTLMENWRKDEAITFPENTVIAEYELSASGSLLPESIDAENKDLLKRSHTEWLFIVLSNKLYQAYQGELDELQSQVESLETYNKSIWDTMKDFWDKVQTQINEQNIFRDHSESLRERTNSLFAKLKDLRALEDSAFEKESRKNFDEVSAQIDKIEAELETAQDTFGLFEALKNIQKDFKNIKLSRTLRSELWTKLDDAFKSVKNKRNPNAVAANPANENRLVKRIEGLREAIAKMQESIARDEKEINFVNQRLGGNATTTNVGNQLETQLREVRTKLIQERIDSKNVKLEDMFQTLKDLEARHQKALAKKATEEEQVVEENVGNDEANIQNV